MELIMKIEEFLTRNPVFTIDEWKDYLASKGSEKQNTRWNLLAYHQDKGRILQIRRGLYATVPAGSSPESFQVDPFLVAAKLKPDSVLALHAALEFHGKAYSTFKRLTYTSAKRSAPLKYQSHEYIRISEQLAFRKNLAGVTTVLRSHIEVRVTNFERTLVDVLHRPDLSGSWEEIWRSLGSIEYFDIEQVIKYVKVLKNATTAARVGFFLDQHTDALLLDNSWIAPLLRLAPRQPHYMDRLNRKDCKLIKDWNLMVPTKILDRSWDELS
jgi:predicted transcriptional regulator of viral defense system